MADDPYYLQRSAISSTRLNLQHYIFRDTFGFDLHPSIPTKRDDLRVADLGPGTGLWLIKVAEQLPTSTKLDGFDISNEQFPHQSSLPPNITMRIRNASEPAPASLHGQYDIVNLRLFLAVVQNNDPRALIKHAFSLLKPGGFLQWSEFDVTTFKAVAPSGVSKVASNQIFESLNSLGPRGWVSELPKLFEECGLSCVACARQREHAWQRQMLVDNTCMVSEETVLTMIRNATNISQKQSGEALLKSARQSREEARNGVYYSTIFQMVLGRKPIDGPVI